MANQVRQNYHEECEAAVNIQINNELHCSYVYQAIAFHFDRDTAALPGFHKFFKRLSEEYREQAENLMKYQNTRGGRLLLQDVKRPDRDDWGNGLDAMKLALQFERNSNQSLMDLHTVAERHEDSQFCDFLEGGYLKPKVELIKEIGDHITKIQRVGPGLGEYTFDKEELQE